jgi:hypothetical protein
METVLDLYEEEPDPRRPRVCFDEQPYQMLSEVEAPLPRECGQPLRQDYQYQREGTCNLFLFFSPDTGWREVKVTDQRTAIDFAHCMRDLVDLHCPDADVVRVVLDNLNIHSPASLYEAFEPAEARRIAKKLEFVFTPKHGSWLNMAEIELSVMTRQCLDRRLPSRERVATEVTAWVKDRNASRATVQWRFTNAHARTKLQRLYPSSFSR